MSEEPSSEPSPFDLSPEEVERLEGKLLATPDDLALRQTLLMYYMHAGFQFREAKRQHIRHIHWIIQNHPGSYLAGTPFVLLPHERDREAVRQAISLWQEQAEKHPESATVLGHGAQFLIHSDPASWPQARLWLTRAETYDPANPEWPQLLGRLADFERRALSGAENESKAQQALGHYERAYGLTSEEESKALLLADLSRNALAAGTWEKARDYATALLEVSGRCETAEHWNYGNSLHWGHITLGKAALHNEDIERAKTHFREAGATPGSPQLYSFGPDFTLARDLLKRKEKEAVLDYLKACMRFWQLGQQQLVAWQEAIGQGETPDFSSSCRIS